MEKTAGKFMKAGVIYAILGFAMGLAMGASKNFGMVSVHTHLNLVGWATMGIYAAYYQLVPEAGGTVAAKVHFWLANIGLLALAAGVAMIVAGMAAGEAGAAIGSFVSLASILLFGYIVFKTA